MTYNHKKGHIHWEIQFKLDSHQILKNSSQLANVPYV